MTPAQARFQTLWSRCGGVQAETVCADLMRHYAEPARHYHTLRHVRHCIRDLDWARAAIPAPDTVELALWCHDVIYLPGAPDNELQSAEWFHRWAQGRFAEANRIIEMVLATTHAVVPADLDSRYTVDIDLADMASNRARFRRAGALLRAERPDLDDVAYDAHERDFLGALLTRPHIYHTDLFHARCEARARNNVAWRLAQPVPPNPRCAINRGGKP
jgi:predicted metal-dependent HD superfamily phosphohydrolase